MNRSELLKTGVSKDEAIAINNAIEGDAVFLRRKKRDIEDSIEDLKRNLKSRLTSTVPIDSAVVESMYGEIKDKEALLERYKSFESEYISNKPFDAGAR